MVAPDYANKRSEFAKKIGLGRGGRPRRPAGVVARLPDRNIVRIHARRCETSRRPSIFLLFSQEIAKFVERSLFQRGFCCRPWREDARLNARTPANSGHAQESTLRHDLEINRVATLPLRPRCSGAFAAFRRHA